MGERIQICNHGAENLRLGIIKQAKKDYMDNCLYDEKHEAGEFFYSEWGRFLTGGIDPDTIIKSIKEQAEYKEWRKFTGCVQCKREECPHRKGNYARKWVCEKEAG